MKAWKLGSVLILVALLCAACGGNNATTDNANHAANKNGPAATTNANTANTNTVPASPTEILGATGEGAALYEGRNCYVCHGGTGKGNATMKNIPNFTDPAWQKKATDDEMFKVIRNGKPPMPAYNTKQLTDEQIKTLIIYIRSLAK
ncbi:MAG TPA: cytochrome c [Blastocatellia bacterium]|nr:cytochrome c [Blastocatellia bacterium]